MKRLIITAVSLLALSASASFAGDNSCYGPIEVGFEWTLVHTGVNNVPADNEVCRFKTASPVGQRILRMCPNGSECELSLSIDNNPKDHRVDYVDGKAVRTIINWPQHGVQR